MTARFAPERGHACSFAPSAERAQRRAFELVANGIAARLRILDGATCYSLPT